MEWTAEQEKTHLLNMQAHVILMLADLIKTKDLKDSQVAMIKMFRLAAYRTLDVYQQPGQKPQDASSIISSIPTGLSGQEGPG